MDVKAGWRTSEFWAMVLNTVVNVLVAFNVLDQASADSLYAVVFPLALSVIGVLAYIQSRKSVKVAAAVNGSG